MPDADLSVKSNASTRRVCPLAVSSPPEDLYIRVLAKSLMFEDLQGEDQQAQLRIMQLDCASILALRIYPGTARVCVNQQGK